MLTPIFSVTKVIEGHIVEVLEYGQPIYPESLYRGSLFRIMNEAHKEFESVLIGRGEK